MSTRVTGLAVLATIGTVSGAAAQETNPFQTIEFGETLSGFLTTSDDSLVDGSFFKMFLLAGAAGDSVTVGVSSIDFNAHLLFADSLDTILSTDDNTGGHCNAHLNWVLPSSGRYIIYVTTTNPHEVGEFALSLVRGTRAPADSSPCSGFFQSVGTVAVGDSVNTVLGPPKDQMLRQSYYQVWDLRVAQDDTVTVDLRSGDFDARLALYRGFGTLVAADDDGGGACHSRLVVVGTGHPLRLLLTSGKANETGEFDLLVVPGSLPVVQESQCAP